MDKPQVQEVNADPNEVDDRMGDIRAALEASEPKEVTPAVIPAAKPVEVKESAPAAPETPPDVTAETPPPEVQATGAEPIALAVTDKIEPPSNWPVADKERFKEWPETAQKQFLDRYKAMEADYTKKTMANADFTKEYGAIDEMFTPYKGQLRQAGFSPATAVRAWMAAEQALMNPQTRDEALKTIAGNYGIDLAKLAGVQAASPVPQAVDPANMTEEQQLEAMLNPFLKKATAPYEQQIAELKTKLSQFDQFQTNSRQAEFGRIQSNIMTEIQTFATAKDAAGNLAHPYFADVEANMATTLAGYHAMKMPAPPLQELYDMAVYANPSTRERLSAQQKTAAEAQRASEVRAKAAKATRAGSSVTGSPTSGQAFAHANGADQEVPLRDSLVAAYEAQLGR